MSQSAPPNCLIARLHESREIQPYARGRNEQKSLQPAGLRGRKQGLLWLWLTRKGRECGELEKACKHRARSSGVGHQKFMADVVVAKSKIHDLGVFAARDFAESEIILPLDDSRVVDAAHPLDPELGEYDYHCDYLAGGKTVLMRSPERHINSCCDPNTFVKTINGVRYVVARKAVKTGEEITCDYIIDCHGGIVWQCNCGSARCRGTIVSSFFELPLELQLEYLPLLNQWFIDEHGEKIDVLLRRAADASQLIQGANRFIER